MIATIWEPAAGIEGPCAEISLTLSRDGTLSVTMHFSDVRGLPNRDLRIQFAGALALHWEDECPGFYPVPPEMAKCSNPQWASWVFPLHKIEDSELLEQFRAVYEVGAAPRLAHFLLIAMDDLVHIIARSDATASWVPGVAAQA
jgi:hypothetical protein